MVEFGGPYGGRPVNPTNDQPLPDYTPEQKAEILAEMKKKFTVEDLIGYIENDEPVVPADEVMAKADEIIRRAGVTGKESPK